MTERTWMGDLPSTRVLPRPEPKLPDGWTHQGNLWMHVTGATCLFVDGKVKAASVHATNALELGNGGEALRNLGRWLEAGGRP
ncbi:MAG: hypothetical protein IT477_10875 [Rhodanobacteraceae bacterium]|nr:hypothetical protein [Rhodanobacteraceae bacterium]